MAGHSHSKNVRRVKEAGDKQRALIFAKIGKNISLLAKQGGGDVESNPALRTMIEKARELNVPKDNIEKVIKRGTGEFGKSGGLENFIFEAYGPGGIAIIAEGITDNKNRSIAEFKKTISNLGGKVAEPGSVRWLFKLTGSILIDCSDCDEMELIAIETGAQETEITEDGLEIIVDPEKMTNMRAELEKKGAKLEASLIWLPLNPIKLKDEDEEKAQEIFDALNSNEDIQEIFSNKI